MYYVLSEFVLVNILFHFITTLTHVNGSEWAYFFSGVEFFLARERKGYRLTV